ncbi:GNAT family N-acetyltransferase [Clostridiaceae bacterium M8S5]|nr:GNAT family N-acetyltransferase [Clostridiaceae bacterium M8S5]
MDKDISKHNILYESGSKELLPHIKELWEETAKYHMEKSQYFRKSFVNIKFEDRLKSFEDDNKEVLVILVKDEASNNIGYIVASITKNKIAEIESFYIIEKYRNRKIGNKLMDDAISWLEYRNPKKISVGVAVGNEDVMRLYQKFGFYPKVIILEKL